MHDPLMRHKQDPTSVRASVCAHCTVQVCILAVMFLCKHYAQGGPYVAELQQENFNPILMYKAQEELDSSFPSLSSDSFVLALQTEFQLELYTKFACFFSALH